MSQNPKKKQIMVVISLYEAGHAGYWMEESGVEHGKSLHHPQHGDPVERERDSGHCEVHTAADDVIILEQSPSTLHWVCTPV